MCKCANESMSKCENELMCERVSHEKWEYNSCEIRLSEIEK